MDELCDFFFLVLGSVGKCKGGLGWIVIWVEIWDGLEIGLGWMIFGVGERIVCTKKNKEKSE